MRKRLALTCWRWAALSRAPVQRWWSSCCFWGSRQEAPGLTSGPARSLSPPAPPTEQAPWAAPTSPVDPPSHPSQDKMEVCLETGSCNLLNIFTAMTQYLCCKISLAISSPVVQEWRGHRRETPEGREESAFHILQVKNLGLLTLKSRCPWVFCENTLLECTRVLVETYAESGPTTWKQTLSLK